MAFGCANSMFKVGVWVQSPPGDPLKQLDTII